MGVAVVLFVVSIALIALKLFKVINGKCGIVLIPTYVFVAYLALLIYGISALLNNLG